MVTDLEKALEWLGDAMDDIWYSYEKENEGGPVYAKLHTAWEILQYLVEEERKR